MFGVFAAIAAAFSWTIACVIWRSQTKYFSAVQINILKNIIAATIFLPVIFTIDWFGQAPSILILILSGLIGIALGDCFYINSLRILGTRRTLTVEAFSPILANVFGALIIGELLPLKVWIGGAILTISLVLVGQEQDEYNQLVINEKFTISRGYLFSFLSVICAVLAATLSRLVLKDTTLSPLQTTEIRLIGSLIFLLPLFGSYLPFEPKNFSRGNQFSFFIATLLGTNMGILLQQTVFKLLPLGLGWTLLSISPVVSLLFANLEGDHINTMKVILAIMALLAVGIALL